MAREFPGFGVSINELQAVLLGTSSIEGFLRELAVLAARTLGQRTARGERIWKAAAGALSVILVVGYLSVPFAVITGLVN